LKVTVALIQSTSLTSALVSPFLLLIDYDLTSCVHLDHLFFLNELNQLVDAIWTACLDWHL
jgi:hypothetical protein